MNLRALPLRVTTSLVSVIGIAGVVLILVALLSISEGFRRTLELSGSDRVAIVLRGSSSAEMTSSFSRDQVQIIEQTAGIARDARGPIVSAELYTTVDQTKRSTGTAANAPFRGIEAPVLRPARISSWSPDACSEREPTKSSSVTAPKNR